MEKIKTLQQAIIHFSDFDRCQQFVIESRWPDGKVRCPYCGSEDVLYLKNARLWYCKLGQHSRRKFSLKVGTLFEDSAIPLQKWLPACWLLYNCKNGVSSYEIHRDLKVTQKTAWFMLHRIRLAAHSETFEKLSGEIEVDESFIGGKARNMHADKRREKITGTGGMGKVAVMGLLERHGKVHTRIVPNVRKKRLQAEVREHVEPGAHLYTDALKSYEGLDADYVHQVIDHAEAYARGSVHTNGLENFWSLLKRGIKGTYVSVEPFHLFRYLDEQAFRFNNRNDMDDGDRFRLAMSKIVGKRLTYAQLTGKTQGDTRQQN